MMPWPLLRHALTFMREPADLIDVGVGIRPQPFFPQARAICIEPHHEYADWLEARGFQVRRGTALECLPALPMVDTVMMLDVIEHMERPEAERVLVLAKERARHQVVVFTPLGFRTQEYGPGERDAWGMNGTFWQTHRSGWEPQDFPGWQTFVDPNFSSKGGAFVALWTREGVSA